MATRDRVRQHRPARSRSSSGRVGRSAEQDLLERDGGVTAEPAPDAAYRRISALPLLRLPGEMVGWQTAIGNRAVQRMLVSRTGAGVEASLAPVFAKVQGDEDEFALIEAARQLLAKTALDIQPGAAPTNTLPARMYGMTFPEQVGVEIGASLEATGTTWKPVVKKITGHYSMQTRLLPGQQEITGPGGNTARANYCTQCQSLELLGEVPVKSHPWYIIDAVIAHEKVHATRFLPAMQAAEAAITSAIEAVTVPHTDPMTEAEAIAKLEASGLYQTALKKAYQIWLAKCAARVAGDHDRGGPTELAEEAITGPLRQKICAHAKKQKWPACDSCNS